MSRSYKKGFICKQQNVQGMKKIFNRRLRRSQVYYKGMSYKKLNLSWDICDWRFVLSKEQVIKQYKDKIYRIKMK